MRDIVTTALELAGFVCLVAAAAITYGLGAALAVAGFLLVSIGVIAGRE